MPVDGCRYTRYSPGWYCDIWIIVYVITLFVVTTKSLSLFLFFLSLSVLTAIFQVDRLAGTRMSPFWIY